MRIEALPLPCHVLLGTAQLSTQDVRNIQVGDVLLLEQAVTQPLKMVVGNKALFTVIPGLEGTRRAVQIVEKQ